MLKKQARSLDLRACISVLFFYGTKLVLAYSTQGAYPIFGQIGKCGSRLNAIIGIAHCRVVHIATYVANKFFHIKINYKLNFSGVRSGHSFGKPAVPFCKYMQSCSIHLFYFGKFIASSTASLLFNRFTLPLSRRRIHPAHCLMQHELAISALRRTLPGRTQRCGVPKDGKLWYFSHSLPSVCRLMQ